MLKPKDRYKGFPRKSNKHFKLEIKSIVLFKKYTEGTIVVRRKYLKISNIKRLKPIDFVVLLQ